MPFFAVLEDGGDEVADPVDDPPDVDADHEFPVTGRHVDHSGAVHRHARIVAGDMELAEIAFGFGQSIEHGLLLRDIDPHRHNPFVCAGETVGRLFHRIFLYVGHDDICTGLCECCRNTEANAGSS